MLAIKGDTMSNGEYLSEKDVPKSDIKKFTLRLGPDAFSELEWLSRKHGNISIAEVLRRAVSTEKFFVEQKELGETVLLENKRTGRQRELVMK